MGKRKKIPDILKKVKNYKPPFIDFSKQKVISHTQLTIFNNCNYSWGLKYRDKNKIEIPSINLIYGTSLHNTIQSFIEVFYNESKTKAMSLDLETMFKDKLRKSYLDEYKKNKNIHFSSADELEEFCNDGLETLRYLKNKIGKYFSKRGWWLLGCEIPLNYNIIPNVFYNGFIDIALYHEPTDTVLILDLKTSTHSWSKKYQQKDLTKISQLLLYKKIFSKQFDISEDKIDVKFLILKRKLYEDCDFTQSRIQEFKPASGKIKLKQADDLLNNFVKNAFNEYGEFKKETFLKNVSVNNCRFCPFNQREDLCDKNKPNYKWRNPFDII